MRNIRIILGFTLMVFVTQNCIGQISSFGDAEGEGSIPLRGNAILLNAKESSFAIGYSPKEFSEDATYNWAINLKAKSKNGTASVIKSSEFNLKTTMSAPISFKYKGNWRQYFFITPELSFSRPSIFDSSAKIAELVEPSNSLGASIGFGYNNEALTKRSFIFGSSLKIGIGDNTAFLDPLSIQTVKYIIKDSSNQVQAISEEEAYILEEYSAEKSYFRLNLDFGNTFYDDRLLWVLQARVKGDKSYRNSYDLGFGVYATKDGAPLDVIGGLQVLTTDLLNYRSDKSFSKRTVLNLVAAIKF